MEQIASKTFASQFINPRQSKIFSKFQRMVLAVKNGRIQLLHTIPSNEEELKQKDENDKNLLFYAVYEKQAFALLYLMVRGLAFTQPDKQKKNIMHICGYYGSIQCLQAFNVHYKLINLQKLYDSFLQMLQNYNFKRTDAKNGELKYSVSPKKMQVYRKLQSQVTEAYLAYLKTYLSQTLDLFRQIEQLEQRNSLHMVCLNKYQKCFLTLQLMFNIMQQPDLCLNETIVSQYDAISKIIGIKIDPRLYVDLLKIMQNFIVPESLIHIHNQYQIQLKNGIKELLEAKDKDQKTPLYIASKNGSTKMINFLKKYAPKTKEEDKKQIIKVAGHNLARSHILDLCEASTLIDTKPLNFLLSCGEDINNKKTIYGTFALLEAVKSFQIEKNIEPIKVLLKNCADVNTQDTNGWTVLHHAAYNGELQIFQLLFSERQKNQLNLNKLTNKRYHALHLAAISNHPNIIQYLVETCGIQIDILDWDGCTPLHHAAKKGSINSIKKLFQLGANIYAQDNLKMTPLHHAAVSNHSECIKQLIKYDSDEDKLLDMRNSKGKKAKDLATNTNSFNNIFSAVRTGSSNNIRKLLENNPQLKDEGTLGKNRTPLILAVICQQLTSVKFLMQVGADTYHQDNEQKSAGTYAEEAVIHAKRQKNKQKVSLAQQIKEIVEQG